MKKTIAWNWIVQFLHEKAWDFISACESMGCEKFISHVLLLSCTFEHAEVAA